MDAPSRATHMGGYSVESGAVSTLSGRWTGLILVLGLLGAAPRSFGDPGELGESVNVQVARARRHVGEIGVHVVEVASGREVYSFRADRAMIPASNQKLLTTAAALDRLGAGFLFTTTLELRGELDGEGVLHGDLAVEGSGDPTISGRFENGDSYGLFRRWARALEKRGIRGVTGDLYLDHGLFDDERFHPAWPEDQQMWWYGAPVDALSFNDNCQLLRVWGTRPERSGIVDLLPRLPLLRVRNGLVTTARRSEHRWRVHRDPGSTVLEVDGRIQSGARFREAWVTVEDPVVYFGEALRAALAEEGLELRGRVRPVEDLPGPVWTRVAVHRRPLIDIVDVANKRSQNLFAESLFKRLGAEICRSGTWDGGARAVEGFLAERMDRPMADARISDGSGLSRSNRIAPRQLTALLRSMFLHPDGLEFVRSLPFSGEERGSLRDRLDEPPYRANVFAKTGTLRGVSALSGFAKGRSGTIYAFSILSNRGPAWRAREAQDRIVEALVDRG